MLSRRAPDTRIILVAVILLFLAAMAWWWSLRAGRLEASTAPTPITGAAPVDQSPAGAAAPVAPR